MSVITAISKDVFGIGANVKQYYFPDASNMIRTKRHYIWEFEIDSVRYKVEFIVSFLTGKKRVKLNGDYLFKDRSYKYSFIAEISITEYNFNFPFTIGSTLLQIS